VRLSNFQIGSAIKNKACLATVVAKIIKKYDIKWKKFVTRRNKKLTYMVPGVVR
jgi:hypothetical protein